MTSYLRGRYKLETQWLYHAIGQSCRSKLCIGATLHLVISEAKALEPYISPVSLSIVFYMFRGRINGEKTRRSLRL